MVLVGNDSCNSELAQSSLAYVTDNSVERFVALIQMLKLCSLNASSLDPAFLYFGFIFNFGIFTFQQSGQTGSCKLYLSNLVTQGRGPTPALLFGLKHHTHIHY